MEQLERELQEVWAEWSKEIDAPWEDPNFNPRSKEAEERHALHWERVAMQEYEDDYYFDQP